MTLPRFFRNIFFLAVTLVLILHYSHAGAQQSQKRLIMKDGSYQTVTKWEINGERVRYYSSERFDWEELPKELVDWPATEKYNKDREGEREQTIKEVVRADEADERDAPLLVPGLRLPSTGGVFLFESFNSQPQLVELLQNGGELNKHTGRNILRAAINPLQLSSSQTIELKGEHARVQSHIGQPAIYLNVESSGSSEPVFAQKAPDKDPQASHYGIVRVGTKKAMRVVGKLNVAVYGKVSQKENWIPVTTSALGEWIKLTPTENLPPGEYAVVELLEKKQINFFVWDFGVNPSAPGNAGAWIPRQPESGAPGPGQIPALEKRPK